MTAFIYDDSVPAVNNDPTDDQPVMLQNAISLGDIWDVDHIGFNANNGGTHAKVTFPNVFSPGNQPFPQSVIYSGNGINQHALYRNSAAAFDMTAIRAYGVFTMSSGFGPGTVPLETGVNVVTPITKNSLNDYTIQLISNVATGSNVAVFISTSFEGQRSTWTFTNPNLNIVFTGTFIAGIKVSFAVLQF